MSALHGPIKFQNAIHNFATDLLLLVLASYYSSRPWRLDADGDLIMMLYRGHALGIASVRLASASQGRWESVGGTRKV